MKNTIVCYFSASGRTKDIADKIANSLAASLFEIVPEEKYTDADLNWHDENSRSSIEMRDVSSRPKIVSKANLDDCDVVLIGYPIWWDLAPTIINTFIEENDLSNKEIHLFATSGGSSIDNSVKELKNTYPNLNIVNGKLLRSSMSMDELIDFIK